MNGAILPLPQYAFMAWCSVKAQGQLYLYSNIYGSSNAYEGHLKFIEFVSARLSYSLLYPFVISTSILAWCILSSTDSCTFLPERTESLRALKSFLVSSAIIILFRMRGELSHTNLQFLEIFAAFMRISWKISNLSLAYPTAKYPSRLHNRCDRTPSYRYFSDVETQSFSDGEVIMLFCLQAWSWSTYKWWALCYAFWQVKIQLQMCFS